MRTAMQISPTNGTLLDQTRDQPPLDGPPPSAIAERASSVARPPGNALGPPLLSTPPLVLAMHLCFLFSASVCELHFEPVSSSNGGTDGVRGWRHNSDWTLTGVSRGGLFTCLNRHTQWLVKHQRKMNCINSSMKTRGL